MSKSTVIDPTSFDLAQHMFEELQPTFHAQSAVENMLADFDLLVIAEVLRHHDFPSQTKVSGSETIFKFPTEEGQKQWLHILEEHGITRKCFPNPRDYYWRADNVFKRIRPFSDDSEGKIEHTTLKLVIKRGTVEYWVE